jgi:hypothetical protein
MDNALAGQGVRGVEGQGTDNAVFDLGIWGVQGCAVQRVVLWEGGWLCVGRRPHVHGVWEGPGSVLTVLLGERQLCDRQHGGSGRGEGVVQCMTWGSWAPAFGDKVVVLSGYVIGHGHMAGNIAW